LSRDAEIAVDHLAQLRDIRKKLRLDLLGSSITIGSDELARANESKESQEPKAAGLPSKIAVPSAALSSSYDSNGSISTSELASAGVAATSSGSADAPMIVD